MDLRKRRFFSPDNLISLTTSDHVNVLACRLVRIDFKVSNVCALLNKNASPSDIEDMERFRVPLAFGKKIDVMDIYSKITGKEYVVFKSRIGKKAINKMDFEKIASGTHNPTCSGEDKDQRGAGLSRRR